MKYWDILQRKLPGLLLVSFVVAILMFVVVSRMSAGWRAHFSYLVSLQSQEETEDYKFDGYYVIQATELFSETLAAWLMTPEIIVAAHERAGLSLATSDPRKLTGMVESSQTAPQLVEVIIKTGSREYAERLTEGLIIEMSERVGQYQEAGSPALKFLVVNTELWVGKQEISAPIIASAGFVFVLLLGINMVFLIEVLRYENSD